MKYLPIDLFDLVESGEAQPLLPSTDANQHIYAPYLRYACSTTNYVTNPAFVNSSGGIATGLALAGTYTGTPLTTIVAGAPIRGNWQRLQYTGVAGDAAGKTLALVYTTPAASFASASPMEFSVWCKGSATGITITPTIESRAAGEAVVNSATGAAVTLTDLPQKVYAACTSCGATTDHVAFYLALSGINEGDTVDLYFGNAICTKISTNVPVRYFDGSMPGYPWAGTADASTTTPTGSGTNVRFEGAHPAGQVINESVGTIITGVSWEYPPAATATAMSGVFVARNSAATVNTLLVSRTSGASTFDFKITDDAAGTATATTAAINWAQDEIIPVVARYSIPGGTIDLCVKETEAAQAAHALTLPQMTWWGSVCTADPMMAPTYILRRRIADSDFAAFKAYVTANLQNPMTMWRDVLQVGDSMWPLTGNTVGYQKVSGKW